ncbi:MAG: APC family permease [Acidobacteriota bacterium]
MSSDMGQAVESAPPLKRVVSRWEILALVLNDVIGSGVYLLPAAAAAILGAASLLAVIVAGLAVMLIVLCFAEASSHFESPGGAYLYTRHAFGTFVGFEVGWMAWLARVTSVASLSAGFAQALGYLWPGADAGGGRIAAIAIPILALGAINMLGVDLGARTGALLAIVKIVPLLIVVVPGLFMISWSQLGHISTPGSRGLGEAAMLLLFAYAGFENTPATAGEYKNPRRDVPFALLAQMAIVTLLYSLVQLVALGTLPDLAASKTPLAEAAAAIFGPWGGWLLTAGAALSILGTNSASVLHGPRYLYALAVDGFGPRALAAVHPRFRTPAVAIAVQTVIALPLALTGSFVELAALSVIARMASYIGTAAAVPKLRRAFPDARVRLPGGYLIPALALMLCLGLLASATRKNLIAGSIAIAVGALLYSLRRRPAQKS